MTTTGEYRYVGRLVARFDLAGRISQIIEPRSQMVRVAGGSNPDAVEPDAGTQTRVVNPVNAFLDRLRRADRGAAGRPPR